MKKTMNTLVGILKRMCKGVMCHLFMARALYGGWDWTLPCVVVTVFLTAMNVLFVAWMFVVIWGFSQMTGNIPLSVVIVIGIFAMINHVITKVNEKDDKGRDKGRDSK